LPCPFWGVRSPPNPTRKIPTTLSGGAVHALPDVALPDVALPDVALPAIGICQMPYYPIGWHYPP